MTWVFTALVTASGQAWAGFDVYMPKDWAKDPQRRERAGIPDRLTFATKPELAAGQLKRLMAAGVRALRAAADEVCGRCGEFRDTLRALPLAYVVIISCNQPVAIAEDKGHPCWRSRIRRSVREAPVRERGERPPLRRPGAHRDRRPAGVPADPPPARAREEPVHLLPVPEDRPATMTCFVTIAGRRWPAGETFKTGKDTLGWDQSQARTYDAICRHTALTALAQLRAAAVRAALTGAAVVLPAAPAAAENTAHTRRLTGQPR